MKGLIDISKEILEHPKLDLVVEGRWQRLREALAKAVQERDTLKAAVTGIWRVIEDLNLA